MTKIHFEPETDTIRKLPENYCLAVRDSEGWSTRVKDGAVNVYEKIDALIKEHNFINGELLARIIANKITWRKGYSHI